MGIKVTRIEIRDVRPPRELIDSMNAQMKAERNKPCRSIGSRRYSSSRNSTCRRGKQARILKAEGERQEAFLQAEARERAAEAEAKATQMVSEAIASGDTKAINYFIAQKYTEALKQIGGSPNSKMVMMPLEAGNLIGSVVGIRRTVKRRQKRNFLKCG